MSPVLVIIFMDRNSGVQIQGAEGVKFSGLRIPSLLFADDMVLLASSNSVLQLILGSESLNMAISSISGSGSPVREK